MTLNLKTLIQPSEALIIEQYIRTALIRSALPQYRSTVKGIVTPTFTEARPLHKVLSKLISPFCTQEAGGFETVHRVSQDRIEDTLAAELNQFDGLVCGIESSADSIVYSSRKWILSNSAVVYPSSGFPLGYLSEEGTIRTQGTRAKINRYVQNDGATIWMGHLRSGTSDPELFPYNRQCFLDVVSGHVSLDNLTFDPTKDISFWDANFDCTDLINTKFGMESTIEILLNFTNIHAVQFIIPTVRVRKCRFAERPFANNQIQKGGIEQIAESMIATCPRGSHVAAIDSDGLFVLSEGSIYLLLPKQVPIRIDSIASMQWKQYHAFSSAILLDHKPIRVQVDGQQYAFHNFMDFKGVIGVMGTSWYDSNRLSEEEIAFMDYLRDNYDR